MGLGAVEKTIFDPQGSRGGGCARSHLSFGEIQLCPHKQRGNSNICSNPECTEWHMFLEDRKHTSHNLQGHGHHELEDKEDRV